MAPRRPRHRHPGRPHHNRNCRACPRRNLGGSTSLLSCPPLGNRGRTRRRLPFDGPDNAILHARPRRSLDRGDRSLLPRASGRHRHASVLVEAARRRDHCRLRRQRGARGTEHLQRGRHRIVAMDQAATFRAGGARPPHHADQRCGGRHVGGFPRAAHRHRVCARDAVQGRPRARGAVAVANSIGGSLRDAGFDRRRATAVRFCRQHQLPRARRVVVGAARRRHRAHRDRLRHHLSARPPIFHHQPGYRTG